MPLQTGVGGGAGLGVGPDFSGLAPDRGKSSSVEGGADGDTQEGTAVWTGQRGRRGSRRTRARGPRAVVMRGGVLSQWIPGLRLYTGRTDRLVSS